MNPSRLHHPLIALVLFVMILVAALVLDWSLLGSLLLAGGIAAVYLAKSKVS